jgi:hypothetical protein
MSVYTHGYGQVEVGSFFFCKGREERRERERERERVNS